MEKCDYGCDQIAMYKLKSGKKCCSKSVNSCPAMKLKNSNGMKKARDKAGDNFWKNGYPNPRLGKNPWNKGLTKETDNRILIQSEKNKGNKFGGKALTPEKEKERTRKISEYAKLNNGGYRKGSGRGKSGRYKGFWCDSSWELAYIIYNLEHNIYFERNKEKFSYMFNGKKFNFIPDFIENGQFVEIKGYYSKQWEAKLNDFPHKIKILYKSDMKKYFDYVIDKYGKDFIKLYE
jgi:hypothetical protein